MMKRIIFLFLTVSVCMLNMFAVNIVPLPYYAKVNGKSFNLQSNFDYEKVLMESAFPQIKSFHAGVLGQSQDFDALCRKVGFFKQELGEEGYELLIDNNRVILAANTERGIFYGKQSIIQLVRSAKNNKLQGVHIIDKPALKYRGVMDDISRGPVPSNEYMKYQIRRISELKMNVLCYYTEHIVQTKKHPEFAPSGGSITVEEWAELAEYAKKYYVELIPNFQSLGHAEKVLMNPKYCHLGESSGMYAPTNPQTVAFMKDIYDEMCPAFMSQFFHVNCDETFDLGRGASKKMTDSIGVGRVYANYMNQLADILAGNGKRMMMWGDIVLQHPEVLDMLPSNVVMMTWEYGDKDSYAAWISPFADKGIDFMVCPGVLNSLRLFPDYGQALPNIRKFVSEGLAAGTMGMFNTVWDDGGLHSFDRDWYGVAYGAEQSWNPNDRDIKDFDVRLSTGVYGGSDDNLFQAIHKLMEMGEIPALDNMSEVLFWKTIIPERGKFSRYSFADWEEVYEACLEVDSLLKQKNVENYNREYAAFQIVSDEYKYLSQAKLKLAEASDLYSQACVIQFENRSEAQTLLQRSKADIIHCRDLAVKLRDDFSVIWKNENREYWLNYALDPFNKLLADYDDMLVSFDYSIKNFERHQPLAAPADIRLDIRELEGTYFTYWLVSPAFNLTKGQSFETDFLKEMGGEKNAAPFPGFSFFDENKKNIKWMKYSSALSDKVSMTDAVESADNAVSYAYCTIESPDDRVVTASFGMHGGITVICNGERVFKKQGNETLLIDELQCQLKLKSGRNRILLKLEKGINNLWDFSFTIKDVGISSSKNKYRIK